jgi:hypothetical protein
MFMVPISNIYFYGSGRINSGNLLRFSAKQNPLSHALHWVLADISLCKNNFANFEKFMHKVV